MNNTNKHKYRLVYRGTNRNAENEADSDTGFIMSDATSIAYIENNYNFSKAVDAGIARDVELLKTCGSAKNMARIQSTSET